ncbi:MAG TPA: disulfide bond formation protein B [Rhodocyclaceae bacterium]|nr:disulfide bond formation protein B [Rhodocyclaceae bacterium]
MPILERLREPRTPFLITLVLGLGLVVGGVLFAEFMRLAACPLCVVQRMLYLLAALFAALGLLAPGRLSQVAMLVVMLATNATGMFVAGYQVWLQRFSPDTSCSGVMTWWEDLVDRAGEQVPLLFKASGLCSDPAWKFLGLSIADWSLCFFTALFVVAVIGIVAALRRK